MRLPQAQTSLHSLQFGVLGDHLLEAVRNETYSEFEIVTRTFRAQDGSITVFGVFNPRAERPCTGGLLFYLRLERRCGLLLAASQHFHDGINGVVAGPFELHRRFAA